MARKTSSYSLDTHAALFELANFLAARPNAQGKLSWPGPKESKRACVHCCRTHPFNIHRSHSQSPLSPPLKALNPKPLNPKPLSLHAFPFPRFKPRHRGSGGSSGAGAEPELTALTAICCCCCKGPKDIHSWTTRTRRILLEPLANSIIPLRGIFVELLHPVAHVHRLRQARKAWQNVRLAHSVFFSLSARSEYSGVTTGRLPSEMRSGAHGTLTRALASLLDSVLFRLIFGQGLRWLARILVAGKGPAGTGPVRLPERPGHHVTSQKTSLLGFGGLGV